MLSRISTFSHVLVLVAVLLFLAAFCITLGWFSGEIGNAPAWEAVGLATLAASFLPWR